MSLLFLTLASYLASSIIASPLPDPQLSSQRDMVGTPNAYSIQITVGTSNFDVGNTTDPSTLTSLVTSGCNLPNGCVSSPMI
jgi:hypothetical protein